MNFYERKIFEILQRSTEIVDIVSEIRVYLKAFKDNAEIIEEAKPEPTAPAYGKLFLSYDRDNPKIAAQFEKGVNLKSQPDVISSNSNEGENMKYITKRKDGRWQGSKSIEGKRVFVYGKTQKECYEKLKAVGKARKKSPKVASLYEFAIYFLENYKKNSVSARTYDGYKSTINRYLKIGTPLNKITTIQLQDLLNKLPATRIRTEVYQLIRQIFKKAHELDLIKKDVAQFLERGKIEKAERRALNLEEQQSLVRALLTDDDLFSQRVLVYLCTGARPSEFATINREELRPGWLKINGTKTAKAVRWVKISDKLYTLLQAAPSNFFVFDAKRFR